MAAIGTQYRPYPEARYHGVEFHVYCAKTIPLALNWTIPVMQAILITEIFTRFRGKKATVRLSLQFEELYSRLLNLTYPTSETEFATNNASTCAGLTGHFNTRATSKDIQSNWLLWVDTESRQRLLCLCFIFDIHQATFYQQKRAKSYVNPTVLYAPCSEVLWESTNAADWAMNETGDNAGQPLHLLQYQFTKEHHFELSHFARSLILCPLTSQQLPSSVVCDYHNLSDFKIHNTDPAILQLVTLSSASSMVLTYVALYHTPLRDLLAVSGDTWVFTQKITHPSHFREAQSRLKLWSSSIAAATAAHYACRVLLSEFSAPCYASSDNKTMHHSLDLSHYWSLNVAALICWAFGHRVSGIRGTSLRNVTDPYTTLDSNNSPEAARENVRLKALTYLNCMLELDIKDLLTSKSIMRAETSFIIDAVCMRLEVDSVGGQCMTLVDSICVLKRLRESGRGKWF